MCQADVRKIKPLVHGFAVGMIAGAAPAAGEAQVLALEKSGGLGSAVDACQKGAPVLEVLVPSSYVAATPAGGAMCVYQPVSATRPV
jgi:hypothetical protein